MLTPIGSGDRGNGGIVGRRAIWTGLLVVLLLAAPLSAVSLAGSARPAAHVVAVNGAAPDAYASAAHPCDPLEPSSYCLLPFPDDYFTTPDPHSATGLSVNFPVAAMPKNSSGVPIDPSAWQASDGFSPGAEILTRVPGIDLAKTGAPPVTDPYAALAPNSPMVIVDTATGQRHPFWAELDANAQGNPSQQALILRPAVNLAEGHHYVVALRDLVSSAGAPIGANPSFAAARDAACGTGRGRGRGDRDDHGQGDDHTNGGNDHSAGRDSTPADGSLNGAAEGSNSSAGALDPALAAQVPRLRSDFAALRRSGVGCSDLYLAWDFTVASPQNVTGRLLHIRDDAFRQLGNAAPQFTVNSVTNFTTAQNADLARQVSGTFDVPSYLNQPGGPPGSTFNYQGSADGLPTHRPGNVQVANFLCDIPRATIADATSTVDTVYPGRASLYGHGLLGSASELNAYDVGQIANGHDFVFCATDEIGMSSQDVPEVLKIFANLSLFPTVPDRLQQGMLNELFLGRLMTSSAGFVSSPAFRGGAGDKALIDTSALHYLGYSQGGILGGVLTAVSQSFTRSVLGVPGMNFSTLINRSSDGAPFIALLDQSYPNKLDQQLDFALIQMLWDRGEPDGYAQFMTDHPLPGTPSHQVLIEEAFGDHQVANVTTSVEARTIGAKAYEPALPPGVVPYNPLIGIPTIDSPAYSGSGIVMWYAPGQPPAPLTDTPPTAGHDPHENPRLTPASQLQEAVFLLTGRFIDTCGGQACIAPPASPGMS